MPNDPAVWVALLVVVALLIALALWLGRGLRISKDKDGFLVEAKEYRSEKTVDQTISVAKDVEIERARVGDIAGIKGEEVSNISEAKQSIDVFSGGTLKDAQAGDIVGIKQEGKSSGADHGH